MDNRLSFKVEDNEAGERIDKYLAQRVEDLTRSAISSLISSGKVTVNGTAVSKNYKVKNLDMVEITVPEPVEYEAKAENIPLDIVYEDESLLVVNKPKGMVVHPAAGNYEGTLVNALLYHCRDSLSGINGVMRPGIVHRIDKNTSGLLIVAKTDFAHKVLAEQIKEHSFSREYEAVDAPIGRHHTDRKKMCVTEKNSRNAVTHYRVLEEFRNYSHIACKLETGRTHQIRVHMAYLGHPVAGDDVYGKPLSDFEGQCLHAKKIGFVHPVTEKYMEFDSPLPDYFKKFLDKLHKIGY